MMAGMCSSQSSSLVTFASATRTIDASPFRIPIENTWSIEDVRFTEDEYIDYISRFCKSQLGLKECSIKLLVEYIGNTTGGHPGLIALFMNKIKHHFSSNLKYVKELTFEKIFLYLKSYEFSITVQMVS